MTNELKERFSELEGDTKDSSLANEMQFAEDTSSDFAKRMQNIINDPQDVELDSQTARYLKELLNDPIIGYKNSIKLLEAGGLWSQNMEKDGNVAPPKIEDILKLFIKNGQKSFINFLKDSVKNKLILLEPIISNKCFLETVNNQKLTTGNSLFSDRNIGMLSSIEKDINLENLFTKITGWKVAIEITEEPYDRTFSETFPGFGLKTINDLKATPLNLDLFYQRIKARYATKTRLPNIKRYGLMQLDRILKELPPLDKDKNFSVLEFIDNEFRYSIYNRWSAFPLKTDVLIAGWRDNQIQIFLEKSSSHKTRSENLDEKGITYDKFRPSMVIDCQKINTTDNCFDF